MKTSVKAFAIDAQIGQRAALPAYMSCVPQGRHVQIWRQGVNMPFSGASMHTQQTGGAGSSRATAAVALDEAFFRRRAARLLPALSCIGSA